MTPKEKAQKLVYDFFQTTPNEAWFNPPVGVQSYKGWEQAKECALIAVDLFLTDKSIIKTSFDFKYWNEVKQEIEKL